MNRPTRSTLLECCLCLVLAAFYSCPARAEEPEFTIYRAFIACAQTEADKYQAVSNNATEIARAAVTKCNDPWRKGFADAMRQKKLIVGDRQRRLFRNEMELQDYVDKHVAALVDTITTYVLESRKVAPSDRPKLKQSRPKGTEI